LKGITPVHPKGCTPIPQALFTELIGLALLFSLFTARAAAITITPARSLKGYPKRPNGAIFTPSLTPVEVIGEGPI
jgi:hypothetical protein